MNELYNYSIELLFSLSYYNFYFYLHLHFAFDLYFCFIKKSLLINHYVY